MIVLVDKKKFVRAIALLLCLIAVIVLVSNCGKIKKKPYPTEYASFVEKYASEFNVDKYLVYSVIKAESDFEPGKVSEKGAVGLMQLMPDTAAELAQQLGISDYSEDKLDGIELNVMLGTYYLSFLNGRYNGDIDTVLAAYNAGYGNVDKWLASEQTDVITKDIIPYAETVKYIVKVNKCYEKYNELYNK